MFPLLGGLITGRIKFGLSLAEIQTPTRLYIYIYLNQAKMVLIRKQACCYSKIYNRLRFLQGYKKQKDFVKNRKLSITKLYWIDKRRSTNYVKKYQSKKEQ